MDDLFSKLALQAVTTVGKAAFGMAVNKAVQRLKEYSESRTAPSRPGSIQSGDGSGSSDKHDDDYQQPVTGQEEMSDELRHEFHQLDDLRAKLQQKVAILTPSIDMIQVLSVLLNQVLAPGPGSSSSTCAGAAAGDDSGERSPAQTLALARAVTARVQRIMDKIEDSVPYINLALSISGVKLGQFTPASSSSSALLPGGGISLHTWFNASNLVAASEPDADVGGVGDGDWVPMTFACRVYRLFEASVRKDGLPNWTWKLEHLMSSVHVWRHRPDGSGASKLVVLEATPMPGEKSQVLAFELAELKAMFFTATGRLLNIPDANPGMPVLVVHLDEYVAIEIVDARELQDESDSDSEVDDDSDDAEEDEEDELPIPTRNDLAHCPWLHPPHSSSFPTSHNLALLESVLRLVTLEQTLGTSHLAVPDDVLWAHLSSDQSPSIGSMAQQSTIPLPPAYSTPATPPSVSRSDAGSGSASARRRSRRSFTAAAAAASGPVTPTAPPKAGGKRPKSRMAAIRDGESGPATPEAGAATSGEGKDGKLQRTPAPVRALNLMERFMSLDKDKDNKDN
ncbi:hypothetical protein BCR44DRAFT_1442998 [Catenaria anguillulae PL171]|uniref:RanGTP-binding protein-domain-containing protein n=1 Tax=Catenaria anguillulae PL171 TaxID=765915 RepID=A0A1Y2H959_9FUNG|nr:hypothetical protein BCR44DRAFT_1442998 [Catenaria anguillulae PL171]